MGRIGLVHRPKRRPNGVTKADRGAQYTSGAYLAAVEKYGVRQSMNSDGGRFDLERMGIGN